MKTCKTCGISKELKDFRPCSTCKGGYKIHCRKCLNKEAKTSSYYKIGQRKSLLSRYGLSMQDYETMVEKQGGKCSICGATSPGGERKHWSIDHDHLTGKIRGLLCGLCNVGLGHFRDSEQLLYNAIDYLKRTK